MEPDNQTKEAMLESEVMELRKKVAELEAELEEESKEHDHSLRMLDNRLTELEELQEKYKEFFNLAKSKLSEDIRSYLLDPINVDKFIWTISRAFGDDAVYINGNDIHATFIEKDNYWNYYILNSFEYKKISDKEFFKYLKLSAFT